jgi:ABC-type lipoprotein export system ATPase subunit
MSQVRYARFWKCALQVNPWDYSLKYRGIDHGLDEGAYNEQILDICKSEDISVVGIADHGSVDALEALREVLLKGGITVFPGFEVASSEKAHFVCLFPEKTSVQQLERFLGCLKLTGIEEGTRPSSLSAEQLLQELEQLNGFVYAAHCTEQSGVLHRQLNHVWKNPLLLAAQIPGRIEELSNGSRQILLNKNPDYRRERPIGRINARDVAEPRDLKSITACSLIRMTDPGFDAFRQAFLDPESRVRLVSDQEERFYSRLEGVRFTGGYLDGVDIRLSGHLDTIIGGRGTGKTTLLECLRYVMEQEPISERARRTHREIVKQNLGAGRVEIQVRSQIMQGRRFTISRRYGEDAMVQDESGNASSFRPGEVLPRLEFFGQNEIFDVAQDERGLTRLLDRFLFSGATSAQKQSEIRNKLQDNAKRLLDAREKLAEIEDQVARLPKLEEQAKQFQDIGLDEQLAIVPRLEKEKQLSLRVEEEQRNLEEARLVFQDALPDTTFLNDEAIKELPHADYLRAIRYALEVQNRELNKILGNIKKIMEMAKLETTGNLSKLKQAIGEDEATLERVFAQIPAFQGRPGREVGSAYQQILKDIARIRPLKSKRDTRQSLVSHLRMERDNLLAYFSKINADKAAGIDKELKILQKKLSGKLKLYVDHGANRRILKDFILACGLEGIGEARLKWLDDADDFSPGKLANAIRKGVTAIKGAGWGITPAVADALTKMSESKLLDLEGMELPDIIRLELNIAHREKEEYRSIAKLSTGQQCTAVLHLLLLDNPDPLIVDQPEDNLDNAFIAERIVSELRSAKISRQFIFATHNANIPVFGDAEWIGVMQAGEDQATLPDNFQGAVDVLEIREQSASILEGGREAFIQRKNKYGF